MQKILGVLKFDAVNSIVKYYWIVLGFLFIAWHFCQKSQRIHIHRKNVCKYSNKKQSFFAFTLIFKQDLSIHIMDGGKRPLKRLFSGDTSLSGCIKISTDYSETIAEWMGKLKKKLARAWHSFHMWWELES